jgi:two-component system response regulator PhoP
MRILLIEDDAQLREQTKLALQKQNLTIDTAADGKEGLYLGLEYPMTLPSLI